MKSRRTILNPEPDLPVFYLGENLFLVDLDENVLVDVTDFSNIISFGEMDDEPGEDWYRLLYDPAVRKRHLPAPDAGELPPQILLLEIPDKSQLDPYRFYARLGMKQKLVPDSLRRKARIPHRAHALVKVSFGTHSYFADYRQLAFIDPLHPESRIDFSTFRETYKGTLTAYYDPFNRAVFPVGRETEAKDCLTVTVPHFRLLDPTGWQLLEQLRSEILLQESVEAPAFAKPLEETLQRLTRYLRTAESKTLQRPH